MGCLEQGGEKNSSFMLAWVRHPHETEASGKGALLLPQGQGWKLQFMHNLLVGLPPGVKGITHHYTCTQSNSAGCQFVPGFNARCWLFTTLGV